MCVCICARDVGLYMCVHIFTCLCTSTCVHVFLSVCGEWSECKFEKQNCLEDSCHSLTLSLRIGLDMTCPGILPPPHN